MQILHFLKSRLDSNIESKSSNNTYLNIQVLLSAPKTTSK